MKHLNTQIASRQPLRAAGSSGTLLERVTLRDGRTLIRKGVRRHRDWMARVSDDRGRIVSWWDAGILRSMPTSIDHAIEAVERTPDGGWDIFMRDVSAALVRTSRPLGRRERQRLLHGLRAFHTSVAPADVADSCALLTRYTMFSPATAAAEAQRGNRHGEVIGRGWEAFADLVEPAVAEAVLAIAAAPEPLVADLSEHEQAIVHGDLRLDNLGLAGDTLVMIDWGERIGIAPPAVDLAWLIGFDGYRIGVGLDAFVEEVHTVYGCRLDPHSLSTAICGALVQLGGIIGHWVANARTDDERQLYRSHLTWLSMRARKALEQHGWTV